MKNETFLGDCLIENEKIKSGSADLILTDLPFGTVQNIGNSENVAHGMQGKTEWDKVIDTDKIMQIANRILRKNGKMCLFAQQPFTNELINKAHKNMPHNYNMIWEKDHFANALTAKKAPLNYYEDVLVFSKSSEAIAPHDYEGFHPLRPYFESLIVCIGLTKKAIIDKIGQKADHVLRINSTQFKLCTEKTYLELIDVFSIDKIEGFKQFVELKEINLQFKKSKENERLKYLADHNEKYPSTFNLWEGKKYKSNILKYKKDYDGLHPTQKPVLLLEDLIKTFSNEGDTVVDLTAGSFSTAIACINTNRFYKCIEKDENYYKIGINRIKEREAMLF